MRRILLLLTVCAAMSVMTACGDNTANNATNRMANNANATNTNTAASAASIEAEIKKMVSDTAAALAKNDVTVLERMYADNYMLVNLDGSVQDRASRLASIRSGETKFDSFVYDEVTVRTNPEGTGAVVIARANASGVNKGQKLSGLIRVTQVWSKTKDGWRQASGHATQIAAATGAGSGLPTPTPGVQSGGLPTPAKPTGGLPLPTPGVPNR